MSATVTCSIVAYMVGFACSTLLARLAFRATLQKIRAEVAEHRNKIEAALTVQPRRPTHE